MIHLRVRTEFSYRQAYGPVPKVVERLKAIGTTAAGIVDTAGTWGHTEWEKACSVAGIQPMFGREWKIDRGGKNPVMWGLAEDMAAFYRASSNHPSEEEWAETKGIIRFPGWALNDPETFDYIDINPRSRRATKRALELAKRTNKPIVITADNSFPAPEDWRLYLAWNDGKQMTEQSIPSKEALEACFPGLGKGLIQEAWKSANEIAERTKGVCLRKSPAIEFGSDELLLAQVEKGRCMRLERGHIKEWTREYQERLDMEVALVFEKGFRSYFLVVADLIVEAKKKMLVGPARGSSAGSLMCYLLEITEVDPLVHGLIFERFISHDRFDMPDIDIDFNDAKRHLVFEYLEGKYGRENTARIGSINRLQAKSAINHVCKKMGVPIGAGLKVSNVLPIYSSGDSRYGKALEDTLAGTNPGKEFLQRYPEMELIKELELHASHSGQHAAGFIVSNHPITEYCTVDNGIAQLDKYGAEYLSLLKIDILGLRTLGVLEDCEILDSQGFYDLRLDDPNVFQVFEDQKHSGIFQFEGATQRKVSDRLAINSFQKLDHATALARPGPLIGGGFDMYRERECGAEIVYHHPTMKPYLEETKGVILYQEQVMRVVKEIGKFSWAETSFIRKAMSGRKGKEFFDTHKERFKEGAATSDIDGDAAERIWHELCNFGAWGMNKSHTVSYAIISYWCGWMKAYHPVKFAAAILRNAKDDEQTLEVLREMAREGIKFIPFDPELSEQSWSVKEDSLVGGFDNIVGVGPAKAAALIEKRNAGKLSKKEISTLRKKELKFDSLSVAKTIWGKYYNNPDLLNVKGRIKEFGDLADRENGVVIFKLTAMKRRDQNEALLVGKRGYEKQGQTLFLDMYGVDDSIARPAVVRIKEAQWKSTGETLADRAQKGDWFLVRGFWLKDINMLIAEKIRCLSRPEILTR